MRKAELPHTATVEPVSLNANGTPKTATNGKPLFDSTVTAPCRFINRSSLSYTDRMTDVNAQGAVVFATGASEGQALASDGTSFGIAEGSRVTVLNRKYQMGSVDHGSDITGRPFAVRVMLRGLST